MPCDRSTGAASQTAVSSMSQPDMSIQRLRKPIMPTAARIHSTVDSGNSSYKRHRSDSVSRQGSTLNAYAVRATADSFGESDIPCKVVGDVPRRSANTQVCNEQYMHPAARDDIKSVKPMMHRGAATFHSTKGRLMKFGTIPTVVHRGRASAGEKTEITTTTGVLVRSTRKGNPTKYRVTHP